MEIGKSKALDELMAIEHAIENRLLSQAEKRKDDGPKNGTTTDR